jgi:hypothetical protein
LAERAKSAMPAVTMPLKVTHAPASGATCALVAADSPVNSARSQDIPGSRQRAKEPAGITAGRPFRMFVRAGHDADVNSSGGLSPF